MIAADPHIQHLIATFTIKMIRENAINVHGHLPRAMPNLQLLIKLLQMGLHAGQLLSGELTVQQLSEPMELFTVFLSAFSLQLSQEAIRAELSMAPPGVIEHFSSKDREQPSRHPSVDRFLHTSPLCALLWLHHIVLAGDLCPLGTISLSGGTVSSVPVKKTRPFEPSNAFKYLKPLMSMEQQVSA